MFGVITFEKRFHGVQNSGEFIYFMQETRKYNSYVSSINFNQQKNFMTSFYGYVMINKIIKLYVYNTKQRGRLII